LSARTCREWSGSRPDLKTNSLRLSANTGERMTRKTPRSLLAFATAGALTLAVTGSASAAATQATVTVTGGALSITAPANAGSLGTIADTVLGGTIRGPLGHVQVNDARDAPAGTGRPDVRRKRSPGLLD
jgi:hypothetical protein